MRSTRPDPDRRCRLAASPLSARPRLSRLPLLVVPLVLLLGSGGRTVAAQSWLSLEVVRETNLDFGQVVQGAGPVQRLRTSPDVARFKVTGRLPGGGTGQKVVTLRFFVPGNLTGPPGGQVPYSMAGAYNSSANNAASATTFTGTSVDIPLQIPEPGQSGGPGGGVFSAYVYVYGTAMVGSVPVGSYSGQINVTAERKTQSGGTGTVGCGVQWDPSVWYNTGDWVEYQGQGWRALWWNAGNVPGSGGGNGPWEAMGPCGAPPEGPACEAYAWSSSRVYNSGDWATYGGSAWRALFYTRGETPGSAGASGAWENMGPCNGTPWNGTGCAALAWQPTRVYSAGDEATYNGKAWRAAYYTRGNAPGSSNAWVQIQSCGELDVLAAVWRFAPGYWPAADAYRDAVRCPASGPVFGVPAPGASRGGG